MLLTVPYVTTAEFVEYPTFLDLLNLRSGDTQLAHQTAVLNKILLMASQWCDNYCEMGADGTLTAHTRVENKRMRPNRYGQFLWHPDHIPLVSLQSVAYGRTMAQQTVYTSPTIFIEDGRSAVVDLQAGTAQWSGQLQFGPPAVGVELYTTWNYTAGYPNTLLASSVSAGAMSLSVADVTGVQPGQTLRIYDPGLDESVVVGSNWVPTTGSAILPLAAGTLNAHNTTGPVRVSAMGSDVLQASAYYAISMLMRPDTQAEDAFPDMRGGVSTRLADSRKDGSGLVFEAQHLLEPYRRVR